MTNLTEQWRKGELPEGWYYIKCEDGEYIDYYEDEIIGYETKIGWRNYNGIEKVVDEVPSYEEWDKLNNACHELEKETACLTVDIVKLKELLKECKALLSCLQIDDYDGNGLLILNKINKVLGDK